jgi:16S rRNA (guanine527-N7)-methyltransferase
MDALATHQQLLERWRNAMDLVGPGPLMPHYQDSLAATGWLKASGRWADLGSGAGFPGFVLAATFPEATVELVERRAKRAAFLEEAIAAAKLKNAVVRCESVEQLPAAAYNGVISRAYKAPAEVAVDALRLLLPEGILIVLLATEEPPELSGFRLFHVERYTVEQKSRKAAGYIKNA